MTQSRHDKMTAAAVWLASNGAMIGWGDTADGKAVKRRWKSDLVTDPALVPALLGGAKNSVIVPFGRLLIIDIDKYGWYERLVEAGLPETFFVLSPTVRPVPDSANTTYRGRHVYGLLPEGTDPTTIPAVWAGGETRRSVGGEQSMVLGPWSMRQDGVYEVPPGAPRTLAVFPASVVDFLIAHDSKVPTNGARITLASTEGGDWVWDASMGSRHDHLRDRIRGWRGLDADAASLKRRVVGYIDRHAIPLTRDDGSVIDDAELDRMIKGALSKYGDDPPDPTTAPPVITSRTAFDLPYGDPPPLLLDWLEPERTTMLYGTGGTGKGVIAAIFAAKIVRLGLRVMIIDYENHPEEWGGRLRSLVFPDHSQLSEDELKAIAYRAPYDVVTWTGKTGPLWQIAEIVRDDCIAEVIDYLIVDSYTPATDGDDKMGGQKDAQRFAIALTKINLPSLVLAHVSATGERLPDKPFGSVHIRNLVGRLMYAVAQEREDEDAPIPLIAAGATIRVEAKRTKGNRYGRARNRFIEITFGAGGAITWNLDSASSVPPLWKRLHDILVAAEPLGLTVDALTKAHNDDWPDATTKRPSVQSALHRGPDLFAQSSGPRPAKWRAITSRMMHAGGSTNPPASFVEERGIDDASSSANDAPNDALSRLNDASSDARGPKRPKGANDAWSERANDASSGFDLGLDGFIEDAEK